MNFWQLEKDLLADLVLKYKAIECKATDFVSARARTEGWKRLAEELDSVQCLSFYNSALFPATAMHSMFNHYITSSIILFVVQSTKYM